MNENPYLPPQAALLDAHDTNVDPNYGWDVARAQKA